MSKQIVIDGKLKYVYCLKYEFIPNILGLKTKKEIDNLVKDRKDYFNNLNIKINNEIVDFEKFNYQENTKLSIIDLDKINSLDKLKNDLDSGLNEQIEKIDKFKDVFESLYGVEYYIIVSSIHNEKKVLDIINSGNNLYECLFNDNNGIITISKIFENDINLLSLKDNKYKCGNDFLLISNLILNLK